MERISSRQNPLVRRFRQLARGDGAAHDVLLDGEHLIREALASGIRIDLAAFAEASLRSSALGPLAAAVSSAGGRVLSVTPTVLSAISPVRHPSGVVAIAGAPRASLDEALRQQPQLALVLYEIQDPGNVGAIVRAADACGATGIVAGSGTADPYSWKALRGSMGSTFRVPVATGISLDQAENAARARGIRVLAATPRGGTPLTEVDLRAPSAILLGGEGQGVPEEILQRADERISIPMRKPVESLNVAVAAALIVYEAARQRGGRHGPVR